MWYSTKIDETIVSCISYKIKTLNKRYIFHVEADEEEDHNRGRRGEG